MSNQRNVTPHSVKTGDQLYRLRKQYGFIGRMWSSDDYRRARLRLLLENARDFRRSVKLSAALSDLKRADVVSFGATEGPIGNDWQPFRVERGLTASMRGEVSSCGKFTGKFTTNLFDSSSVIFLQNAAGETMRTIIPSPATAAEMLAQSLITWCNEAGREKGYADRWIRERHTHVSSIIHQFALAGQWEHALAHPDIIDAIDASCQNAKESRPVIRIEGTLIQKGVALVTSIEVKNERWMFVPTGFFAALTAAVKQAVPKAEGPRLLAA